MDIVIGLLLLGLIVFVVFRMQSVFGNLLDKLRVKAKQRVFMRQEYAEGQKLVSCQIVFRSDFDIDDIREGILAQIQPVSALAVMQSNFFVDQSSDDLIVFACGNKMQTFFKGALTLAKTDTGVEGSWAIVSWLRHDEIVAARDPMKQILRHIHTGVMNVDPGATFGMIPMQRSPRIVEDYSFQDHVQVDYVQDYEAGLPAVA